MRLPVTLAALITVVSTSTAFSCPFCSAPSLTLTEQLSAAQVAVLTQWSGGEPANRDEGFAGTTVYEVVQIVHDATGKIEKGEKLTIDRYRAGEPGDLFLLLGSLSNGVEWSSPLEVTETCFNYMTQAPTKEAPPVERLAYFMKFLEYPDPLIAGDAYGEFANAPYQDIVPLAPRMPREKLREWLTDETTVPTRIGLYGLMLGLCGEEQDVEFLEKKILEPTEDFRLGIDGVMGGYLLLAGAKGLDLLDKTKLENRDIPFSETFAAMQALRFMWTYGDGAISKDRLRQSMRTLLDRPNMADLVIVDLARWNDWSVMDRLMELYGKDPYDVPSIKRAIVRFLLIAEKAEPTEAEGSDTTRTQKAVAYLEQLRKDDPKTVKAAERYFFE